MTEAHDIPSEASAKLARSSVVGQMLIVRELLGEDVHSAALAGLPPSDAALLTRPDSLGWCDLHVAKNYKDEVARLTGKSSLDFQRWIIRKYAERTVTRIWRLLLAQVWDEAIVKRIPIMYRRTLSRGQMQARFLTPGEALITVTGWPGIPEYEVVALQVGVETILDLTGRVGATAGVSRTTDGVSYSVRWQVK